jgi:chromosome segregation ATPase
MLGIFKWAAIGTLVAGGTLFLLGPEKIKFWAEHGKRLVEEKISEVQGLEGQLSVIETKIQSLDREIQKLKEQVIERRIDTSTMRESIDVKDTALGKLKTNLEKARHLLEEPRDSFVIGRVAYTRHEVEADAEEKLHTHQLQSESLKNLRDTLKMKENALKISEENVARAEALRAELDAKVRLLGAKLERFRAKEILCEATAACVPTDELKTELGSATAMLHEFEKQLDVKDRVLDERMRLAAVPADRVNGIDYEAAPAAETADMAATIRHYFEGTGPAPVAREDR